MEMNNSNTTIDQAADRLTQDATYQGIKKKREWINTIRNSIIISAIGFWFIIAIISAINWTMIESSQGFYVLMGSQIMMREIFPIVITAMIIMVGQLAITIQWRSLDRKLNEHYMDLAQKFRDMIEQMIQAGVAKDHPSLVRMAEHTYRFQRYGQRHTDDSQPDDLELLRSIDYLFMDCAHRAKGLHYDLAKIKEPGEGVDTLFANPVHYAPDNDRHLIEEEPQIEGYQGA